MLSGRQTPTYSYCGEYSRTEGELAAKMADAYGMPPHPWQRLVLNDWLALDDDGKLLNSLCVLPVPRQNGKTGICDPRETWGLIARGEHILHTAQEYQTALKAFDRLREKFGQRKNDPRAKFPELNALVKRYTTSANQMVLDLKNGGHIEFRTRGSSSDMGRGGTFDLVVVDEAQSYTDAQDAALSPLNSAAPHGSPQTILMGTVPDPSTMFKGEKFTSIRANMHQHPYVGACIHEWAAKNIGDVFDKERWYETNPSLGYQLLESALQKDVQTMRPDTFAREHLGWWPETMLSLHPITASDWSACKVDNAPDGEPIAYAVKFSPDGTVGSIAVCVDGDIPFVEVVANRSMRRGVTWFAKWITEREGRVEAVVIDGKSNAQTLNDKLIAEGMDEDLIVRPSTADVIAANTAFVDATREHSVSHAGQPALVDSATLSDYRKIGTDGGFGFQSNDKADATLVEACALAYWCAMSIRRDPRQELRIG